MRAEAEETSGEVTLVVSDQSVLAAGQQVAPQEPQAPKAWAGKRLVALVAVVALVSLLLGIAIMQFIVSPAEIAARTEPPEPGPITAIIEETLIENTIVTRGEVAYADSVEVTIDTAFTEGPAIVTGHIPEVGSVFNAGNVALEVTGRPVIVLAGELPAYRTLSYGMRGPDVFQLKQALAALGLWAGDPESDVYEWDTATAVGQLYENVGYLPETGGEEAQENLRMAQTTVRNAEVGVTRANAAWTAAKDAGATDLSVENAEIEEARAARDDAYAALDLAQQAVLPILPAGEALFLEALPRRVDDVYVKRGDALDGPAMVVSGATLSIVGTVSAQDALLLKDGMKAFYAAPGGEELEATITTIEAPRGSGTSGGEDDGGEGGGQGSSTGRYTLTLDPGELTEEQISDLRGTNVRLSIPVASTEGEVLAVPLAALSAGPDGGNRVELLVPTEADPFATEVVEVEAGLAAGGIVEITSVDERIAPGAKVVVGR